MSHQKRKISTGVLFALLCFCYMLPNYVQYQLPSLGTQLMDEYGLTLGNLSSLFSAPMIPAIVFSLAGGMLLDRLEPKMVIGVGLVLTAIGSIGRIFCVQFGFLFVCMMLTGMTACFITAGAGKIISGIYQTEDISSKMGVLMACSTGAMTVANLTTSYLGSVHTAFLIGAVIASIGVVLWFGLMKRSDLETVDTKRKQENIVYCIRVVLKEQGVWIVAFALFFVMAANVVMSSFLPTALISKGVHSKIAGILAACYTQGNLLGCFVAPLSIKCLKSQKKTLIIFAILAAAGITFAWQIPKTIVTGIVLCLTGIFLGGLVPTLMGVPVQLPQIGTAYAGTAGGVVATIQIGGAVLVPSYILVPIAGENFNFLFGLGGICLLISSFLMIFLKRIK